MPWWADVLLALALAAVFGVVIAVAIEVAKHRAVKPALDRAREALDLLDRTEG